MTTGKKFKLALKNRPDLVVTSGSDTALIVTAGESTYTTVKPSGGKPDWVGIQDVKTGNYWTVKWRGPVGSLHGLFLDPLGDDGNLAPNQLFKFEESKGSFFIQETTENEYVSVGHNGVIVRWEKGDGSTQLWDMT